MLAPAAVRLVRVEPQAVHLIWPHVNHLIWRAMKRGGLSSFLALQASLLADKAQLWLATDGSTIHAAAVTELQQTEWHKACVIMALGGEGMERWMRLLPELEQFAKAQGCSVMRLYGRKGWKRMLTDYRANKIILEKDI